MLRNGRPGQRVRYLSGYTRFKYGRTTECGEVVTEVDFDHRRGDTATILATNRRKRTRTYQILLAPPNKGVLEASPKELCKLEGERHEQANR